MVTSDSKKYFRGCAEAGGVEAEVTIPRIRPQGRRSVPCLLSIILKTPLGSPIRLRELSVEDNFSATNVSNYYDFN